MKSPDFAQVMPLPNFSTSAALDTEGTLPLTTDLQAEQLAATILSRVMRFRRMANSDESCGTENCATCAATHTSKVKSAILKQEPIKFVLPAFPGKSPNPAKVIGHLPDMAEQQALNFLNGLCKQIQTLYAPGAELVICSDGRVFSDVVGMPEEHVTAYQDELEVIMAEQSLTHLSTFNLDALTAGRAFDPVRAELMEEYGQPLEALREKVRRGGRETGSREEQDSHRLFCGITRFMFEDAMHPAQTKSRTAVQKQSRARAYEVIRRSNAWSELIAERFPQAVRLSIHPQICGSKKLGIQLLGANSWMTPWHGVAVDNGREFILMKRWEAERLGSNLISGSSGRPSHYQMLRPSEVVQ